MNFLRLMSYAALRVASMPCKPLTNIVTKRFRKPSICNICVDALQYRPVKFKTIKWVMHKYLKWLPKTEHYKQSFLY